MLESGCYQIMIDHLIVLKINKLLWLSTVSKAAHFYVICDVKEVIVSHNIFDLQKDILDFKVNLFV